MKNIVRRREVIVVDNLKSLYESLSVVARMSPRLVRNYHEQHVERCWCGSWVNNFLTDFVIGERDTRDEALYSLMDHHCYMKNGSDDQFWMMIRRRARRKLGLPRRPLVTRTRG